MLHRLQNVERKLQLGSLLHYARADSDPWRSQNWFGLFQPPCQPVYDRGVGVNAHSYRYPADLVRRIHLSGPVSQELLEVLAIMHMKSPEP